MRVSTKRKTGSLRKTVAGLGILAISILATAAGAQTYPDRPITLVVPFAAGGAADVTGRIIANAMSQTLGKNVIVENIGGAGGATGSARVKNAAPDGYTIGLGHAGTHAAAVAVNPKLPYDPRKDFSYLGLVASTPNIVFVRKDLPPKDLKEFIAYAKAKGLDLKMGHSGVGAASHSGCLLFFQLIGVEPTYVAYRGFGQTINDIISGNLDGSCDLVASVSGHVSGGAVKAYVVASDQRAPTVPDVPTADEAGLPEFKAETWTGLFAPLGTPAPVLAKLREAVAAALADPPTQKRLVDIGARVPRADEQGGDAMLLLVGKEIDRWSKVLGPSAAKP